MIARAILLAMLIVSVTACEHRDVSTLEKEGGESKPIAGGVPGSKGNGGGVEPMNAYVGPFQQWQINAQIPRMPYENPYYQTIKLLAEPGGINCVNLRAIIQLGIRLLQFSAVVDQKFATQELNPPKLDFEKILAQYSRRESCVDLRVDPMADTSQARMILQEKNTFANTDPALMALNFPEQEKVYYFTNNISGEKILQTYKLDLSELRTVEPGIAYPLLYTANMQGNWIFLTLLTLGTHEEMSLNGIREEQNSQYLFSSSFLELFSLNFNSPRLQSKIFMEAVVRYFERAFAELAPLKKNYDRVRALQREQGDGIFKESGAALQDVARGLREYYLAARRVENSYLRVLNFFELVVPGTNQAPRYFLEQGLKPGALLALGGFLSTGPNEEHPYTRLLWRYDRIAGEAKKIADNLRDELLELGQNIEKYAPGFDANNAATPITFEGIGEWNWSPFPDVFQNPDSRPL